MRKFSIVNQVERSIKVEAEENPELKRMFKESMEQYVNGQGMTTSELLKSLSEKDFK